MMNFFKNQSITFRLMVAPLVGCLGALGLMILMIINLYNTMLAERKIGLQNVVESVNSIVSYYERQESTGAMTREAAQEQAKNTIREIRYAGGEYVWINSLD